MSPEQTGLLGDVLAEPEDDTPRLVYADWLEEHATTEAGLARAEFIRLQVWLSRDDSSVAVYPAKYSPQAAAWLVKANELYLRWGVAWWSRDFRDAAALDGTGMQLGRWVVRWCWRRGFIDDLTIPFAAWPQLSRRLTAAWPLTGVTLTGDRPCIISSGKMVRFEYRPDVEAFAAPGAGFDEIYAAILNAGWPRIAFARA